jgi:phage-related tail fiber protein
VTAGGARGVSLQSKTGPSTINALVQAGGQLKTPVRVATTAAVDLTTGGLLTIDGVTLTAGDRVLVKNQSSATENGIYVVSAGSWIRATDANTSALLVPGFVTFAIEGQTQKGGWVFQNPANPILGQTGTGLAFVPVTATLTYGPAKAATTGAIDLTTNGLTAVDGVTLTEGDRVLVKNQANQADNGIYLGTAIGCRGITHELQIVTHDEGRPVSDHRRLDPIDGEGWRQDHELRADPLPQIVGNGSGLR